MQDKSCIDIINTAIQKTLLNTGTVFVFTILEMVLLCALQLI